MRILNGSDFVYTVLPYRIRFIYVTFWMRNAIDRRSDCNPITPRQSILKLYCLYGRQSDINESKNKVLSVNLQVQVSNVFYFSYL